MKLKLFPMFAKMVSIPTNEGKPFNVIFMSENSSFMEVYPKLNIRRQFCKKITAIPFKIPRLLAVMKNLIPYRKALSLIPILKPDNSNVFIDTTEFFNLIDSKFGQQAYRRPNVFQKIVDYFNSAKSFGDADSILIYHVDMSKPIQANILKRRSVVLALMAKVGEGALPFDNAVLAIERPAGIKFYSIFNKNQKPLGFSRVYTILKSLVPKQKDIADAEHIDEPVEKVADAPVMQVAPAKIVSDSYDQSEKESILRFIDKHQKRKVLNS